MSTREHYNFFFFLMGDGLDFFKKICVANNEKLCTYSADNQRSRQFIFTIAI